MKSFRTEICWTLIYVIVFFIWMINERIVGLHDNLISKHATFTNLFFVIAFALYFLALRSKRINDLGGTMTYKQGVKAGIVLTLMIALLSPFTQTVVSKVISPEYFPNMTAYAVENGFMTQEAAEKTFTLKNYIIQSFLGTLVMGIVFSLIAAFLTRKNPVST